MTVACSEAGCSRPVRGRGLCGTHYAYRRRHGTLPVLEWTSGCEVDGCEGRHEAKGLCGKHYQRIKKTGSIEQPLATAPDAQRFWARVDKSGGPTRCWPWTGTIGTGDYGRFWQDGVSQHAHRIAYELSVGPIPAELWIDHRCRNRRCQNPRHLRVVTPATNASAAASASALNSVKTHCKHGHEFTPENIYIHPKRGHRHCRACANARSLQRSRSRSSVVALA